MIICMSAYSFTESGGLKAEFTFIPNMYQPVLLRFRKLLQQPGTMLIGPVKCVTFFEIPRSFLIEQSRSSVGFFHFLSLSQLRDCVDV